MRACAVEYVSIKMVVEALAGCCVRRESSVSGS